MSFLTQAYLLDNYGPRLTVAQLAKVLGLAEGTVRNKIAGGTLSLRTYLADGGRWADYRDVAEYLDECRAGRRSEIPA